MSGQKEIGPSKRHASQSSGRLARQAQDDRRDRAGTRVSQTLMELPSLLRPRASLLIPKCASLQVFPDRICTENLVCCFRENLFGKPCSLRRCETRFPRTLPLVRDLSIGAMRTRSLAVAQAAGEVAVLDMAEYYLAEGREESRTRFVAELREHCHDVGFFYVKNHGVSLPLCDSILSMARDFFDLPSDVKVLLVSLQYCLHLLCMLGCRPDFGLEWPEFTTIGSLPERVC